MDKTGKEYLILLYLIFRQYIGLHFWLRNSIPINFFVTIVALLVPVLSLKVYLRKQNIKSVGIPPKCKTRSLRTCRAYHDDWWPQHQQEWHLLCMCECLLWVILGVGMGWVLKVIWVKNDNSKIVYETYITDTIAFISCNSVAKLYG